MKNSISEQSFYIESEEEDDQHLENEEEGNESDFSNDNNDDENNRPNSLTSAWPQSYRYFTFSFPYTLSTLLFLVFQIRI